MQSAFQRLGGDSPYIIAEAGVNHDGSVDQAIKLVDIAADAGADAVKFQLFNPDELVSSDAPLAAYQERSGESNQKTMLERLTLPHDAYVRLKLHAEKRGIDFITTPFDMASAKFLAALGVKMMKIPSGELTNIPFLRRVAALNIPTILSTGMSNITEIHEAVEPFKDREVPYAILHCVSSYPAPTDQINLRAMETLRTEFGVPIGYSDHSEGIEVSIMAAALGAQIIEKHFTTDRTLPGPDHAASLEPDELKDMILQIRDPQVLKNMSVPESILGSGEKACQPCETGVRDVARRSVVINTKVERGGEILPQMLVIQRPGTGIAPGEIGKIAGKHARADIPAGTPLQWDMLQP